MWRQKNCLPRTIRNFSRPSGPSSLVVWCSLVEQCCGQAYTVTRPPVAGDDQQPVCWQLAKMSEQRGAGDYNIHTTRWTTDMTEDEEWKYSALVPWFNKWEAVDDYFWVASRFNGDLWWEGVLLPMSVYFISISLTAHKLKASWNVNWNFRTDVSTLRQ